jgi:hypothetical protein
VATTQWWRWGKWWHVMAWRQELANWQWMSILMKATISLSMYLI